MLRCDNNGVGGYDGVKMLSLRAGFGTETQTSGQIPQIFKYQICTLQKYSSERYARQNNENGHHMEIGGAADVTIEGCTFTGYTGYRKKKPFSLIA